MTNLNDKDERIDRSLRRSERFDNFIISAVLGVAAGLLLAQVIPFAVVAVAVGVVIGLGVFAFFIIMIPRALAWPRTHSRLLIVSAALLGFGIWGLTEWSTHDGVYQARVVFVVVAGSILFLSSAWRYLSRRARTIRSDDR